MLQPTAPTPTARLLALLRGRTTALREEAVAEARSLGPELAGDLVASLVDAEVSCPAVGATAVNAVHLAGELRLVRALPALVRCIEVLPDSNRLHRAALSALRSLGTVAVDALLAAFARCDSTEERAWIAEALSRTAGDDDRVRAALVRMLEDDPVNGARHLADRGDWRALPDVAGAFDRLVAAPIADCPICEAEQLAAIVAAVRVLGGTLTPEQRERFDEVLERSRRLWTPFDPSSSFDDRLGPARHALRPGRNDPCPCGSGKKYKRCCLEEDERDATH